MISSEAVAATASVGGRNGTHATQAGGLGKADDPTTGCG
jgi:hypothetical protein